MTVDQIVILLDLLQLIKRMEARIDAVTTGSTR